MLSSGAAFLLSLCSSPLKPALLRVCLHPSSLVTLEPFSSSSLANYSSLELSSNSCVCQAAAAVRPKMGLGIWCWVTRVVEWFSGAGELICFYSPSPFPTPHLPAPYMHTFLLHQRKTENNDLSGNVTVFGYQACHLRGTLLYHQSAKQSRALCFRAGTAEQHLYWEGSPGESISFIEKLNRRPDSIFRSHS